MKLEGKAKQIDFRNVEVLNQLLRTDGVSRERFSIEMDASLCANGILAAFRNEVWNRGRELVLDDDTKRHILDAAKWLTDPHGKPGLLLCGLYGNGKTTLAKAIKHFIEWITELDLGYNGRELVCFMTSRQITRLCENEKKRDEYDALFTRKMLIIDELGEEPKEILRFGNIENPLLNIIYERYDKRLFTIITTNLNTDEISAKYGERVYDRFSEILTSIVFENDSYRKMV